MKGPFVFVIYSSARVVSILDKKWLLSHGYQGFTKLRILAMVLAARFLRFIDNRAGSSIIDLFVVDHDKFFLVSKITEVCLLGFY